MFPEEYTPFELKQNANYDGDPQGDYVLAEHINAVQEAIQRIEETIGLQPEMKDTLVARLRALEGQEVLRVPAWAFWTNETLSAADARSPLGQYAHTVFSQPQTGLSEILLERKDKGLTDYGWIDANTALSWNQEQLALFKTSGVTGVLIERFGEQIGIRRSDEQALLNSASEKGLSVILRSSQWNRLLSNTVDAIYNPSGQALVFPEKTMVILDNFAYAGGFIGTESLLQTTLLQVQQFRQKGFGIIGFSNPNTQTAFDTVQTAALLFGLDGLYIGDANGSLMESRSPAYRWPSYVGQWRTDNPLVLMDGTTLYRDIANGKIKLRSDGTFHFDGYTETSDLLDWVNQTVPGQALKDGSVSPSKLSGYDIARIVELLNQSDSGIQIDATKIAADEGGAGLPINIPASNMTQNVVSAINRKGDPLSTASTQIKDYMLESLNASKLTGDISRERFERYVIAAINASATTDNYLNVPRIQAINIGSTGTISANILNADAVTAKVGQYTENLSVLNQTLSGYLTANEGEFLKLYVEQLTVDKLTGLKDLYVENIQADNMDTLVLAAIDANIVNGRFNNIVTQALTADTIQANLITALNTVTGQSITNSALFGEATILDASIKDLSAGKLTSGSINTALVTISSPDGHLQMQDSTLKIYDALDENNERHLRVQLGDVTDLNGNVPTYGLVVLGEDGTTRLYDNTGVYNAGIHPNAISESKIQDSAISERVIAAGAITTDKLFAGSITADKIAVGAITADHIFAGSIVAGKIAADAIEANNIQAGAITTGKLAAGSITAEKIQAGAITAEKLSVGFNTNLIRNGYDSFEQIKAGVFDGLPLAGTATGVISEDWSWDGGKALYLSGNAIQNRIRLAPEVAYYSIAVTPGESYYVSAYVRTSSTNDVPVVIGFAYENETEDYSASMGSFVSKASRTKRIFGRYTVPAGIYHASVTVGVHASNVGVYFDCLQVEKAEEYQSEPGPWKTTATTVIDGDSIQTGFVAARHIRIGSGSVFGDGEVINLTDAGIEARSASGSAMLNSKGLEITGGAFKLSGGIAGQNSVFMDGETGLAVENSFSRIEVDAINGFRIISKSREQIVMDVDPDTGNIRMSGNIQFYSADNPLMSWTMDEKIEELATNTQTLSQQVQTMKDGLICKVDVSSTRGDKLTARNMETIVYATVYYGSEDITATLPDTAFVWKMVDADGLVDEAWGTAHLDSGSSFILNRSELDQLGNIFCDVFF